MFISRTLLNEILTRLDRVERQTGETDRRLTRETGETSRKYAVLFARIKANEEGRFVRDQDTGKMLPVLTRVGECERELNAAAMTMTAAAPADERPLLTEAEKKEQTETSRWTALYRTITGSIQGGATPETLTSEGPWIEGRNSIPALCAKIAPAFYTFLRAAPGTPKRPISFLSCAVYRGAVTTRPRGNGFTGRAYYQPDVVHLFRDAEKIVTENCIYAEFIQEGSHADTQTQKG